MTSRLSTLYCLVNIAKLSTNKAVDGKLSCTILILLNKLFVKESFGGQCFLKTHKVKRTLKIRKSLKKFLLPNLFAPFRVAWGECSSACCHGDHSGGYRRGYREVAVWYTLREQWTSHRRRWQETHQVCIWYYWFYRDVFFFKICLEVKIEDCCYIDAP